MKYVGRPKQLVRRSALALAGAAVFTIPALGLVAVGPAQALADEALPQPAALEAPAVAGAAQSQEQDQAQGEAQAGTQAGGNAQAAAAGPQGESGARGATQAQAQTEARGQGRPQAGAQAREQPQAPAAEAPGWHSGAGGTYYVDPDGSRHTGWLVTDTYEDYGLQRYWLGADGVLRGSSLVDAADAGWWAYSRPEGYVVRGRWVDSSSGLVYLVDNDGRLADPGWHVTSAYGGGLQRYWVDASAHAAVPGYSADGWAHYTLPETGCVARNTTVSVGGKSYYADNDGFLSEITSMSGIDIASWQAGIDISALSNTSFVIVKVSEGTYYTNPYWEQWAEEVVASGKKLGLYHYAGGSSSANAQAQFFLDRVAKYIGQAVMVLDWEGTSNPQFGSGADSTFAKTWITYVKDKTGVTPWVYVSSGIAENYSGIGCPLWVAKYAYKYYSDSGKIMTGYVDNPAFEDQVRAIGNVVCYQYTSCGGVDGYGKAVDINKFYGAPEDWDKYARATRA